MPTDPRIQTIGEVPVQSGVGQMLFENLQETRKREADIKQTGVLEDIRSKHRLAEQESANKLAVGLEDLRNQLAVQRSQQAFQQEMAVKQQAATYLQGLVGQSAQQGVPMPGLTTTTAGTPEAAGFPGTVEARPIEPGAVDIARDVYSQNILTHLKGIEKRTDLSLAAEKKRMLEELDRITEDDARDINMLASKFESYGDKGTADLVRSYSTVGRGSREEWMKFKGAALPKLMTAQAANETRMRIAQEVTARQKEVQKLKSQAAQLVAAPRLEMAQYKQLEGLHRALGTQLSGYADMHQRLEMRLYTETGPEPEAKIRQEMRKIEFEMHSLETAMAQVSAKMAGFTPTVTPPGGTPVPRPTMGGPGVGTAPTSTNADPLGIRR